MKCKINLELRRKIVEIIYHAKEGHIPSSFSILDIINFLYEKILNVNPKVPNSPERDYFILSKGHGCAALYVVLHKFGFLTEEHLEKYSQQKGILGGHPDRTQVPGIEASTGSLGHGMPTAAGLALGLKITQKPNKVFVLVGDGECNEGTIWETALVSSKQRLDNLVVVIDCNESATQILPVQPLLKKWEAFGWEVFESNGHDPIELEKVFDGVLKSEQKKPKVIIANTIKGFGVSFIEGHGKWHHKIPDSQELSKIYQELT